MAHILFLTPQPPWPPEQGTAIRNWGLLSGVAANHTVSLLTFGTGQAAPQLSALCQHVELVPLPRRTRTDRVRTLVASQRPDLADRLKSAAFEVALRKCLDDLQPDIIQVEGLELARFLPLIDRHPRRPRIVFDTHNAEVLIQRRAFETDRGMLSRWPAAAYSAIQAPRLARFEAETLRLVDAVSAVSAEDAAILRELSGVEPVVAPNGLWLDDYRDIEPFVSPAWGSQKPPVVVFSGKMDYRPNIDAMLWFVRSIWPDIRRGNPTAECYIVGKAPTPDIELLDREPGIHVTGHVEAVEPYIVAANVYVAPLRMGGGTRFKLLQAMALRTPIVSTTIGAEGFPVSNGVEMRIVDNPHYFAQAVNGLISNPGHCSDLVTAAYSFVSSNYDWSQIVPIVEALYTAE